MDNFLRVEMLIGEQNLKKLKQSNVLVFGVGGVGGYAVEALARSGVGNLTIVDFDIVNESNINRQIIANYDTVGKQKVELFKQRILSINPNANVCAICQKVDVSNISQFDFCSYDFIVDAIDMVSSKLLIIQKAKENNVPIISCMGTGNKFDPTKLQIADISKTEMCPLAKVMRRELKKLKINKLTVVYSTEQPKKVFVETGKSTPASIIFVPASAGLLIAKHVVCELIKC